MAAGFPDHLGEACPEFFYCGALEGEALAAVVGSGNFKSFVDMTASDERKDAVEKSGMTYADVPVSIGILNTGTASKVVQALGALERPVLVACGSGARASAGIVLAMAAKHQWDSEKAMEFCASFPCASKPPLCSWIQESVTSRTAIQKAVASTSAGSGGLVFRQLFDRESCTYTYILGCPSSQEAVIIDPVDSLVERDIGMVMEMGLVLKFALNTHVHADHITGTGMMKALMPGLKSVISEASGAVADVKVAPGDTVTFGTRSLTVRGTPGHTAGCVTYVLDDSSRAFTGDALMVRGCGRTDFQGGSAATLYDSVWGQIFSLPDEAELYPAHDYRGRTRTTVAEEKAFNPRLCVGKDKFIDMMETLGLGLPSKMDVAVPANMVCGMHELLPEETK